MKKTTYYIFLMILFISVIFSQYELPEMNFLNYDYAHRGHFNEDIPENSLMSIDKAVSLGKGIEIDIRLSKDEKAMVFHDYQLDRMTNQEGSFRKLTKKQLESIHLLDSAEKIPSLEKALDHVNGQVPLILDLKGDIVSETLENEVLKALQDYNGVVYLQSANPITNRYLSNHSDYKIGYITISILPIGDVIFQRFQAYLADIISDFDYVALNGKYFETTELRTLDQHLIWFVNKNQMIRPKKNDNSI